MATCKKVEIVRVDVQLTMNAEEAQFLADVLYHVGGDEHRTRRQYQGPITRALAKAGYEGKFNANDVQGGITFTVPGMARKG